MEEESLQLVNDGVEDFSDGDATHTLRPRRKTVASCTLERKSIMKKVNFSLCVKCTVVS